MDLADDIKYAEKMQRPMQAAILKAVSILLKYKPACYGDVLAALGFEKCKTCNGRGHEEDREATHKVIDTIDASGYGGDCFGVSYTQYKKEPCSAGCLEGWTSTWAKK